MNVLTALTANERIRKWKSLSNYVQALPRRPHVETNDDDGGRGDGDDRGVGNGNCGDGRGGARLKNEENQMSVSVSANRSNRDEDVKIKEEEDDDDDEYDDPFDCSELIIRPSYQLVQSTLSKYVKEWEELDSRIVNVDVNVDTGVDMNMDVDLNLKNENEIDNDNETNGFLLKNEDSGTLFGLNESDIMCTNIDTNTATDGVKTNNSQGGGEEEEKEGGGGGEEGGEEKENEEEEGQESMASVPTGTGDYGGLNWGWHANRIRLPDFFDYACKRQGPPTPPPQPPQPQNNNNNENNKNSNSNTHRRRKRPQPPRRQVISLEDPTQFLDYEGELWKLFSTVPLASDLEKDLLQSAVCVPCQETFRVQREIETGLKEYTRMDAHSLNRLRKRERHHWPRIAVQQQQENSHSHSQSQTHLKRRKKIGSAGVSDGELLFERGLGDICGATIRVECWRRSLKRGSGCDSNKCEVELTESQTLLDLHNVLVECSNDVLFTCGMKQRRKQQAEVEAEAAAGNGGETSTATATETGTATDTTTATATTTTANHADGDEEIVASGYFFIEDTFYTNGDVDYVSPIIEWLNEEVPNPTNASSEKNSDTTATTDEQQTQNKPKTKRKYTPKFSTRCRREYLGISRDADLKVISMSDVKLGDVKFRLACRYVHVFNGDCESAILFSDVSMRLSNENVPVSQYPLVHDIFTTTTSTCTVQEQAACQACERGSAVVMTLEDEMTDGGPTLLCSICYAKLHYNADGTELLYNNFRVVPLTVLQNLRDLSVGNDLTGVLF